MELNRVLLLALVAVIISKNAEATSPLVPPKLHPDRNNEAKSGQIFGDSNVGPGGGGRSFVSNPALLWPKTNGDLVEIPYILDSTFSENDKNLIRAAAEHFTPRTCIKFVEHSDATGISGSYVGVLNSGACSSVIGMVGPGALPINLEADKCLRDGQGTAVHMFAHVLGFYHEHQRPDRDDFITINFDNVCPGKEAEFDIVANAETFDITYDFGSITHFNKLAFSRCDPDVCPEQAASCSDEEGAPTISVIERPGMANLLGQRDVLSILDRAKIVNGYKCERPVGPSIGGK